MTTLVFATLAYVLGAFLLVLLALRAKDAAVPPSLRSMEDGEQMRAVRSRPRSLERRAEPDPFATLT